jgi:hypothetical protein
MKYSNPTTEDVRTRNNWLKRTLAACAFSGFVAFSPLSERTAHAQDAAPQHVLNCTLPGSVTTGTTTVQGCVVRRDPTLTAEVSVQGPLRVNFRFYPVVDPTWFNEQTPTHPRTIEYTVGASGAQAATHTFEGTTSASQFTSPDIQAPLGVGTAIDFSVTVEAGSQVIRVSRPNGVVLVLGTEAIVERRQIDPVPLPRETPEPRETPQPAPQRADPVRRVQGQISGQYMPIRDLGPYGNQGDTYQLGGFGNIPVHPNVSISLGLGTTSHGLSMESIDSATSAGATTRLRSYSAEALAGIFVNHERHSFYLLGSAGWRMTQSHITAGDQSLDNTGHAFNGYGLLGYEYDRYVRARFMVGNDPFNPMAGRLYAALPWTWARTPNAEGFIDLDASLMWLQTMRPRNDGQLGSFALDQDALLMRLPVRVPIYPIGPVVPYLFAAPEYVHSMAGQGSVFNMYLGGALGLDLTPFRMDVYAGSSLQGNPLILLNAGISR